MSLASQYVSTTTRRFGESWTKFWFAPSDPLPLGVIRILTGGLAFYVVSTLSFDLLRFFGPAGVFSLDAVRQIQSGISRFSYLDYAADAQTLWSLHFASLAVLACFTIGLWTKITKFLALVVWISYFHRAPMLTSVTEPIVAMLLAYLCVGPCGATLSVDAALRRRKLPQHARFAAAPSYSANISLRLIQVHTALIYFLMFSGKQSGNFIWWNGTAVWWLIARPDVPLIDLRELHRHPYVVNLWTLSIPLFELAFALLIWNRTVRPLLIALSAVMWTGIALLTGLVPFSVAMFTAGLAFVSAEQWRMLFGRSSGDLRAAGETPSTGRVIAVK